MPLEKFTYLALMLGSFIFPFLFSFEKQIAFYRKWKSLSIAVLISGLFFIVWDSLFTYFGFWSFNDNFTIGLRFLGLPLEEWLFFIVIPYCSVFIYETSKLYLPKLNLNKQIEYVLWLVVLVFTALAVLNFGKWYTFINLISNVLLLIYVLLISDFKKHFTHFALTFAVSFFPMLFVNGVLTSMPVVEYNGKFFSEIRLMDIPIEDFSYFLLLLLMNLVIYEKIEARKTKQSL